MISGALRCAFCHGAPEERLLACPACGALLHAECWSTAGVCPTLGCGALAPSGPRVGSPLGIWPVVLALCLAGFCALAPWLLSQLPRPQPSTALEVRNASGVALHGLVLSMVHPDGFPTAHAERLDAGASLVLSAPNDDYPIDFPWSVRAQANGRVLEWERRDIVPRGERGVAEITSTLELPLVSGFR